MQQLWNHRSWSDGATGENLASGARASGGYHWFERVNNTVSGWNDSHRKRNEAFGYDAALIDWGRYDLTSTHRGKDWSGIWRPCITRCWCQQGSRRLFQTVEWAGCIVRTNGKRGLGEGSWRLCETPREKGISPADVCAGEQTETRIWFVYGANAKIHWNKACFERSNRRGCPFYRLDSIFPNVAAFWQIPPNTRRCCCRGAGKKCVCRCSKNVAYAAKGAMVDPKCSVWYFPCAESRWRNFIRRKRQIGELLRPPTNGRKIEISGALRFYCARRYCSGLCRWICCDRRTRYWEDLSEIWCRTGRLQQPYVKGTGRSIGRRFGRICAFENSSWDMGVCAWRAVDEWAAHCWEIPRHSSSTGLSCLSRSPR